MEVTGVDVAGDASATRTKPRVWCATGDRML